MERLKESNQRDYSSQDTFEREQAYLRAEKRLKELKGFYWHLFWYLVVNAFLIASIAINSKSFDIFNFGTFSTAFFWGIGLFFHWFGVIGKHLTFSKNWEDRKMREFMDKENNY
jgi:hypothetical protein